MAAWGKKNKDDSWHHKSLMDIDNVEYDKDRCFVSRSLSARIIGEDEVIIPAVFLYARGCPREINVTFVDVEDIKWVISREIMGLPRGLEGASGESRTSQVSTSLIEDVFYLTLGTEAEMCTIAFDRTDIEEFLNETSSCVPFGKESYYISYDELENM